MQSVYIAGASAGSGKAAVILGFMEMLYAVNRRVGFFRPMVATGPLDDNLTSLIRDRYDLPFPPEMLYGCTASVARRLIGGGQYDEFLKLILDKYKRLEDECDLVVVSGTDFRGLVPSLEFDFNADLANNLGCALVVVVRGFGRQPNDAVQALQLAHESMRNRGGDVLACIINGVAPKYLDQVRERARALMSAQESVYVLPEQPTLRMSTVGEIGQALGAQCLHGAGDALNQVVTNYTVADMEVPEFLTNHVKDGCLIITAGDRSDIILASLAAEASSSYPRVAGLLLTGGQHPAPSVLRLLGGLERTKLSLLSVKADTFQASLNVNGIEPTILPGDERKIASALGVFESNVDVDELRGRISVRHSERITPLMFEYQLIRRAKSIPRRIVLPEGGDERVLRAAEILQLRRVADLTLLGNPERLARRCAELGITLDGVRIIDPATSPDRERYARVYYELRKHKGISEQMAHDVLVDVSYFGTLMVYCGDADGMVSGANHTTQHTIRPAFETIRTTPGTKQVSSVFFMCMPDRVLVYGDCAINPNPDAEQLADIAISSAATAAAFGVVPLIAMLSYSTGSSGKGEDVDRVREAVRIVRARRPDLHIDGPMQYDAAVDASVAAAKMPESTVAGHATVFIFPDLNTGNNIYKAVQRSSGAVAIGPILQGLKKPVNDLSRGCTVTDIVNTVAITAIQAQIEAQPGDQPAAGSQAQVEWIGTRRPVKSVAQAAS
ncbi:phosphate acetyltransferase [Candidatus Thiodictyon syntrophicum]|jgi:phosphate acetyltransferase|uniref:Phosphate acetyltransferase n=1 Tax=Candidatus Thiodictyon syntrophicum TaxID=1166950 RepID=A0A2K8U886_9GAMM|nr:phosphate acetyltransferase [Candidatus Thiodictyon syntrophicum]AUB81812.1 phosphate acetyltransferase [Candidatus Thiodictyon syntrophicum]